MDDFGNGVLWAPSFEVESATDPDLWLHLFSNLTVNAGSGCYRLSLSGEVEWGYVDGELYVADEGRLAPCVAFRGPIKQLEEAADPWSRWKATGAVLGPGDGLIGDPLTEAETAGLLAPLRSAIQRLHGELAEDVASVKCCFAEVRDGDRSPALDAVWAELGAEGLRAPRDYRVEWPPELAARALACWRLVAPEEIVVGLARSPHRGAMARWSLAIAADAPLTQGQRAAIWNGATRTDSVFAVAVSGAGQPAPTRIDSLRSHSVLATFGPRVYLFTIDGRLLGARLDDRAFAVRDGRLFDLAVETPAGPLIDWPAEADVERRWGYRSSAEDAARLVADARADLAALLQSLASGEASGAGAGALWAAVEAAGEPFEIAPAEVTERAREWAEETLASLALDDVGSPAATVALLADRRPDSTSAEAGEREPFARVRWLAGLPRSRPHDLLGAPPLARVPPEASLNFHIKDHHGLLADTVEQGESEEAAPEKAGADLLMIGPESTLLTLGDDLFLIAADGRLTYFTLDGKSFAAHRDRLVYQGEPKDAPALNDEELLETVRRHLRALSLLTQQGEMVFSTAGFAGVHAPAEHDRFESTHNETEAWARGWLDATAAHLRLGPRPRAPRRDD